MVFVRPVCGVAFVTLVAACGRLRFEPLGDGRLEGSIAQKAYIKASNTGAGDWFSSVALSGDGSTLAVGAPQEDSAATGVDGNQNDNSSSNSGAVYIFKRSGLGWTQEAYVKASNTGANDGFGGNLALSNDGTTLGVGAFGEASAATGIDGNQADNSAPFSGAVYVFTNTGGGWAQQAYIKASNTNSNDGFGNVAISADGSMLAVGAPGEASAATGTGGTQTDNSVTAAGAVYVFVRSGTTWSQQAYIKASNTGANDGFGNSALSADGSIPAVGADGEASAATGIGGNEADNTAPAAGAVYVFERSGTIWTQRAYLKASNTNAMDKFGRRVVLAADGSTLAVRAQAEASAATGIDGNQTDNSAPSAGAVFVFGRNAATWRQEAYVKASNTSSFADFGNSLGLSFDGSMLLVGAQGDASAATGINGDQTSTSEPGSGAVYMYERSAGAWSQRWYLKASNTQTNDDFGRRGALSNDGSTLVVGARGEASAARGINGNQADNSAAEAGAVYVFQ